MQPLHALRARPQPERRRWARLVVGLAAAVAVAGCGFAGIGAPAGSPGDGPPSAALDACLAAVEGAAAIPRRAETPGDLDVAIAVCGSLADLDAAALAFGDAFDGRDPGSVVRERCAAQPTLSAVPICLALDPEGIAVKGLRGTFKRSVPRIAWAAWLDAPTDADIEITVWRRSGDREAIAWRKVVTTDLTTPDRHGLSRDLAGDLDHRAGTYVMRYLVDGLPVAEGTFTLK